MLAMPSIFHPGVGFCTLTIYAYCATPESFLLMSRRFVFHKQENTESKELSCLLIAFKLEVRLELLTLRICVLFSYSNTYPLQLSDLGHYYLKHVWNGKWFCCVLAMHGNS